jgi:integrase
MIRDRGLAGFGVRRVEAARVYFVQYRFGYGRRGRLRWFSIGRHGAIWKDGHPLTLDKARSEAKRLLGLVRNGTDPAEGRDTDKTALTVAELCDEYLKAVPTLPTRRGTIKKASTLATDTGRIERHIKPLLGRLRIDAVTRRDVERFAADVAAGKTKADIKTKTRGRAIVDGGKGTAARTLGLLGAIFSYAVAERHRADNPVRGVRRDPGRQMQRFLSAEEIGRLGAALTSAEAEGVNASAIAAIRLLAFTGARRGEILGLEWRHVDQERGVLRLPDTKTGAREVVLPAPARAVLAGLKRIDGNPYVLPGEKEGTHYAGLPKIWQDIKAKAEMPDLRLHDLRHSFASVAAARGDSLLMIGRLLGHVDPKTTSRYAHLGTDPIKAAAEGVADTIARAMQPKPAKRARKAKVLKLGAR